MEDTIQELQRSFKENRHRTVKLAGGIAIESVPGGEWIIATKRPDGGFIFDSESGTPDQEIVESLGLPEIRVIPEPLQRALASRADGSGQ